MNSGQTVKQLLILLALSATLLSLSGCDGPCEQLLKQVCEEWDDPQKCAEWREIAEQAGDDSCEESLKMLEERQR